MRCLRCLRDLEKWSWIEKMGKNEEKWGKMAAPESPFIHYCPSGKSLLKTLWENNKILVTSIFLLFPQRFLSFPKQISIFNPFPNKPWFLHVCSTSL